jgi:UDP:flavonoid glycosyltransferase YjiC (YdhE family)
MARFLFAWEIGAGAGHLGEITALATGLAKLGHQVEFAFSDLLSHQLAHRKDPVDFQVHRIAQEMTPSQGLPASDNFAETLLGSGFVNAPVLARNVLSWLQILTAHTPDVLVCDGAPTALLAARGMRLRRATVGTGFTLPPLNAPLPLFRDWGEVQADRAIANEYRVVLTLNQVAHNLRLPTVHCLAELYDVDLALIAAWPMFDPYQAHRKREQSVGPLLHSPSAHIPVWPTGDGAKVFAYLFADPAGQWRLHLRALATSPLRVVAHVYGQPSPPPELAAAPNMVWSAQPLHLPTTFRDADLFVTHGGLGSLMLALSHGVPAVVLPQHAEQFLNARAAHAAGAAVFAIADPDNTRSLMLYQQLFNAVAEQLQALSQNARKIAAEFPAEALTDSLDQAVLKLALLAG